MKKTIALIALGAAMILALAGCARQSDNVNTPVESGGNFAPENTQQPSGNSSIQAAANAFSGVSNATPSDAATASDATNEPDATIESATPTPDPGTSPAADDDLFGSSANLDDDDYTGTRLDISAYNFSSLMDTSLGFTFNYPSHWVNNPGVYTVCYKEPVEAGDFPARVAITRKKLTHTADASGITEELKSYLKTIYKQYDTKTFEVGSLDKTIEFMGTKGYSTTYLAFSGETEVKGFVICCQIERTLYVFHFSASYDDYMAMENIMQYMCKSVKSAS